MSKPKITLAQVLINGAKEPFSADDFMNYCKTEHSEENLEFWRDVTQYISLAAPYFPIPSKTMCPASSQTKVGSANIYDVVVSKLKLPSDDAPKVLDDKTKTFLKEKVKYIFDTYVTIGQPKELNMRSSVRKVLNAAKEAGDLNPAIFKRALELIFELMNNDSFPRFVVYATLRARERNIDLSDLSNILIGTMEVDNREPGAVI